MEDLMSRIYDFFFVTNRALLLKILQNQGAIMTTQQEILAKLNAQSIQLDDVLASLDAIEQDIANLKAMIAAGASLEEINAAVDAIGVKISAAKDKAAGIDQQTP